MIKCIKRFDYFPDSQYRDTDFKLMKSKVVRCLMHFPMNFEGPVVDAEKSVVRSFPVFNRYSCVFSAEYSTCTNLKIPDSFHGRHITSIIDKNHVDVNMMLRSVYIPSFILFLGSCAFRECSQLKSINIPDSFIYITQITGPCFYHDFMIQHIDVRFKNSDDWLNTALCIFANIDIMWDENLFPIWPRC